ncbi:Multidrug resistance-associated protein 1-like protein 1, partial [Colletotrichum chlorophyti]
MEASLRVGAKEEPIVHDVTLSIGKSTYTAVIGPIGCGKSTILKAILGEVSVVSGSVCVKQAGLSIAYCDQSAWLRNISVKSNVIGHDEFDQNWYASVVRACALKENISRFREGDDTLVGSGGIALSGGQKQRVRSRGPYMPGNRSFCWTTCSVRWMLPPLKRCSAVYLAQIGYYGKEIRLLFLPLTASFNASSRAWLCERLRNFKAWRLTLLAEVKRPQNSETETPKTTSTSTKTTDNQASQRQAGDFSLYKFYLKSFGPVLTISFAVLAAGYILLGTMPAVSLRIWTERGTNDDMRGAYFGAYLVFCLATVISQ